MSKNSHPFTSSCPVATRAASSLPAARSCAPTGQRRRDYDPSRCAVYRSGTLSHDFCACLLPRDATPGVGLGRTDKGSSLRAAVGRLRQAGGLEQRQTLRRGGAPIPMKPLPREDDGQAVVLAGAAAGVVAPASGEGVCYAMPGARVAAEAGQQFLFSGDARALRGARKGFRRDHGRAGQGAPAALDACQARARAPRLCSGP